MRGDRAFGVNKMNNANHIDIEVAFDAFVKSIGGVVLKAELDPSPDFENADYVFHDLQIVAELKCLQENKLDDPLYMQKIDEAWQRWKKAGLVEGDTPDRILLNQLPELCAKELVSIGSRPLKRIVEKANRQIRETKANRNLPAYKGLLLLANDGNFALPANTQDGLVGGILSNKYSSIDSYVLFSVNMTSQVPGVDIPCMVWIPRGRSMTQSIPPNFLTFLRDRWVDFHEKLSGRKYRRFGDVVES